MVQIKKKKLAETIVDEIRDMILKGHVKEGDKLPNQNSFAEQLGVSRASLREALHTLSMLGVIEQKPGLGTIIRAMPPVFHSKPHLPPLMSDIQAVHELMEARGYVEVGAVELAVAKADSKVKSRMGEIVESMASAIEERQWSKSAMLDAEFHHSIAEAGNNRYMVHIFESLRNSMGQFVSEMLSVMPELMAPAYEEHKEIYRGIVSGNTNVAVNGMRKHLRSINISFRLYYDSYRACEKMDRK